MQNLILRFLMVFVLMFSVSAFAKKQNGKPLSKTKATHAGGGTKIFVPTAEVIKKMKPAQLQAYVHELQALVVDMEQKLYKGKYQASLEEKKQWGLIFKIWSQANAQDVSQSSQKCLFGGRESVMKGKFCTRPADSSCDLEGGAKGYKCGAIFGEVCVSLSGGYDGISQRCRDSSKAFEVTAENIVDLQHTANATQQIYDSYCSGTMSAAKSRDCGIWKSRIDSANSSIGEFIAAQQSVPEAEESPAPVQEEKQEPVEEKPVASEAKCKHDQYDFSLKKGGAGFGDKDGLDDKTADLYEKTNCVLCGFKFVCGKLEGQMLPGEQQALVGAKQFKQVEGKTQTVQASSFCAGANRELLKKYEQCEKTATQTKTFANWKAVYEKVGDKKVDAKDIKNHVQKLYTNGKGLFCSAKPHKLGDTKVEGEGLYESEADYLVKHPNPVLVLPNLKFWTANAAYGDSSRPRTKDNYEKALAEALGLKMNESGSEASFAFPKSLCDRAAEAASGTPAQGQSGEDSAQSE